MMSFADSTSYILTLIAITVSPGSVVLMLMVRAAGDDVKGALGFGVGFALGGVFIITLVCFGLSAWLTEVLEYSKYVMIAYILWLARGIWLGRFNLSAECDAKRGGIASSLGAGMVTCFISPYMTILFPLILPEMMDIRLIEMPQFLIISLLTFAALVFGAGLIVGFSAQLRKLVRSEKSMKIANRILSSILMLAGGWMALA
jgi:threonine/homoserine/homoserine lactone efflux protein